MGKEVRYFIFLAALMGNLCLGIAAQELSSPPPEPMMSTTTEGTRTGCGEGSSGPGIPPPVGLCLPINDYLLPLLMSGVALGAGSLFMLEKKQEVRTSVQ